MTIGKWFKLVEPIGVFVRIIDGEEEVFAGSMFDIPYGYTQAKIGFREEDKEDPDNNYPIYFVDHLGGESSVKYKAGFIINIV